MASRIPLLRCVKCPRQCYTVCHYCGDAVCGDHASLDSRNRWECSKCLAKFYLIWLKAHDYEHSTDLEYKEWLENREWYDQSE